MSEWYDEVYLNPYGQVVLVADRLDGYFMLGYRGKKSIDVNNGKTYFITSLDEIKKGDEGLYEKVMKDLKIEKDYFTYILINKNNFSKYTLTSLFYVARPRKIWINRRNNLLLLINKDNIGRVFNSFHNVKEVKNPDLSKYRRLKFEKTINNNYYVKGINK